MKQPEAIAQIEEAIDLAERTLDRDLNIVGLSGRYSEAVTMCASTIERLTAVGSVYERQVKRALDRKDMGSPYYVDQLLGYDAAVGARETLSPRARCARGGRPN